MKTPTPAYKSLKSALANVSAILRRVPLTENSSNLHHLKVQSYIFLAHAALEQYLEDLALSILDASMHAFNTKKQMNACVVSLIVFETVAQFDENTPRKKIRADVVKDLSAFVNIARAHHSSKIAANNGIKLADQKALFLPVGFDPEEIDSVTANALDTFGIKRGGIAHRVKIKTQETKSSALADTQSILLGLKSFDEEACRVVKEKSMV